MYSYHEINRMGDRIEELERQVEDLRRALDEVVPQYRRLTREVADLRARLREVEGSVEHLTWKPAA